MFNFKRKNKNEKTADEFLNYQFRNANELAQQKQTKIIGIGILLLLLTLFVVFGHFTLSKTNGLEKNGEVAIGIITGLKRNSYRVNDFDGTRVNNYLIQYEFEVKGETINSIKILEKRDYEYYFDYEIKVLDSLQIIFDPTNPKNNRILKK